MSGKSKKPTPLAFLLFAGWIVPGSAHFILDKKFRAALFFVSVGLLFWLGIILKAYIILPGSDGYATESFAIFKFIGALGSGFHFFLACIFKQGMGNIDVLNSLKTALTNEYATTCLYTAGIINILAVIDAIDIRRGKKN